MLPPDRLSAALRGAVLAAATALVFGAQPAFGDDTQEATRLLRAGQHKQALERVNRVLAAKPRDPQARFLRGLILTEQGNTREAIEVFTRLTQDFPELPEPYNNLAVIYAGQGQFDKARVALEQSIRTHPSYATAYENLGDVYAKLASQAYDKALQLDTGNSVAQNKLALVRELVGGGSRAPQTVAAREQKPAASAAPAPAPVSVAATAPAAVPQTPPAPAVTAPAVKPAEIRPTPGKPAAKPAPSGEEAVIEMVKAWANAWSKRDADAYLSFYAKDFKTPHGEARSDWEQVRRQRVSGPKSISVSIDDPEVRIADETSATVSFRQHYRSDVIRSSANKTLDLMKANGRWLIRQEKVGS